MTAGASPRASAAALFLALFLSGVAAIINQTVWQRALRLYLSGSEAISAMIVVVAFLLGLGAGSLAMARKAGGVRNPLRLLGAVELALAATDVAVAFALGFDLGPGVYAFQRSVVALGLPLRGVHALVAGLCLIGPCLLMGVTLPLASEAAQRQIGLGERRFVTVLVFLNTLGAVTGAWAAGAWLLPLAGQRETLLLAAGLNGAAGALLLAFAARRAEPGGPESDPRPAPWRGPLRPEERLGFALGFLALGYEMYLLRAVALAREPLPYNFAAVLSAYLLLWSLGVVAAGWLRPRLRLTLAVTAAAVMAAAALFEAKLGPASVVGFVFFYALPCVGFGLLFGWLVQQLCQSWGNDVGRFHGLNTAGSCLGVLVATLVGYRFHPAYAAVAIGGGYLLLLALSPRHDADRPAAQRGLALAAGAAAVALGIGTLVLVRTALADPAQLRCYFGSEGVVYVIDGHAMFWDGLHHSSLARDGDHVGSHNWMLATVPLMAHPSRQPLEALVIGLGTGITAGTLARSDAVSAVDVYEINGRLAQLLADYPEGTLGVGRDPKLTIRWRDGRTGLALDDHRYDLITQQPMYLRQAGSTLLLSREYMLLVRSRLKPSGVYTVYCSGSPEQARLVRRTAREVFEHGESFGNGYMLVMSREPIDFSPAGLVEKLARFPDTDRVGREIRGYGVARLARELDWPRLDWEAPLAISDDQPLVEYPALAERVLGRTGGGAPGS